MITCTLIFTYQLSYTLKNSSYTNKSDAVRHNTDKHSCFLIMHTSSDIKVLMKMPVNGTRACQKEPTTVTLPLRNWRKCFDSVLDMTPDLLHRLLKVNYIPHANSRKENVIYNTSKSIHCTKNNFVRLHHWIIGFVQF